MGTGGTGHRQSSPTATLARLGFTDPQRALTLLQDDALAGLVDPFDDVFDDGVLRALSDTADPDQALLALVRVLTAAHDQHTGSERRGADSDRLAPGRLHALVRSPGEGRDRLLAVLGASAALGDHLVRHPDHWTALTAPEPELPEELRQDLLEAVGADPAAEVPVATLRRAGRARTPCACRTDAGCSPWPDATWPPRSPRSSSTGCRSSSRTSPPLRWRPHSPSPAASSTTTGRVAGWRWSRWGRPAGAS